MRPLALLLAFVDAPIVDASIHSKLHTENLLPPRLPPLSSWPHRPVFVQPGAETSVLGLQPDQALPLGVVFEFDSPIFKGKLLIRLRNAKSDDHPKHEAYFTAGKNKRLVQTVVQGQFKKPLNMSDVFVGSSFEKPLKQTPPAFLMRMIRSVMQRIAPGIVLDLASPKPRIVALYAGTAHSMSIDLPGQEPDMTEINIPENVARNLGDIHTGKRRKMLSKPHKAANYQFDTEHVYTFHTFDEAMDLGTHTMNLPMYGEYALSNVFGHQPICVSATTSTGETMFSFRIWHENALHPPEEI